MSTLPPAEQVRYFRKRQSEIVETIRQLVEIESPSDVKQAVDRLGTVLASRFGELGGRSVTPAPCQGGPQLVSRRWAIRFQPIGEWFQRSRIGACENIGLVQRVEECS